jgi:hypothetical protein
MILKFSDESLQVPPNSGYSFLSVLKQCGHAVTIFFCFVGIQNLDIHHGLHLKKNSFPALAGSPVQLSSVPKQQRYICTV